MFDSFSNPYLKILLALRPLLSTLIGFSFSCLKIPALYAQIKAMQITRIILDSLPVSVNPHCSFYPVSFCKSKRKCILFRFCCILICFAGYTSHKIISCYNYNLYIIMNKFLTKFP